MQAPQFNFSQLNTCMTAISKKQSPCAAIKEYKGWFPVLYDFFALLFGTNISNGRQEIANLTELAKIGDAVQQKNLKTRKFAGTDVLQTNLLEIDGHGGKQYGYLMQLNNEIHVVRKAECLADKTIYIYKNLTFSQIQDQLIAHEHEFNCVSHEFNWLKSDGSSDFSNLINYFIENHPNTHQIDLFVRQSFRRIKNISDSWEINISSPPDESEAPPDPDNDNQVDIPAFYTRYLLKEVKNGIDIFKADNLNIDTTHSLKTWVKTVPNLNFNDIKQKAARK